MKCGLSHCLQGAAAALVCFDLSDLSTLQKCQVALPLVIGGAGAGAGGGGDGGGGGWW